MSSEANSGASSDFASELIALDIRAELGEGPLWDDRRQRLLFVDIMRGHVHEFDPAAGTDRLVEFPWPVGAVALHENGDWVLAAANGFYAANPATGETRLIAAVEADRPGNRMNDGYVDARGRFWAGTMGMNKVRNAGTLYRLDPDGSVSPMVTGVSTSNGIDWSLDNCTAYYVDTPTGRIDTFDFDLTAGVLSRRRPFVQIASADGFPDGLIVDAEGFVWLCLWKGAAVRRYSPDGRLDRTIPMPVTQVTKCAFGGPGLDELFITTAGIGLSEAERAAQPLAGALFRIRPGVKGRTVNRFGALRTLLCLAWLLLAVNPAAAQGRSSEAGSSAFAEASADRRSLGGGWLDPADQRIDALGSEPQPRGEWRVGAFVGVAHKSPINPRLGQTPDRDHVFVGLQAQTTVLKIGGSRFSWGIQFLPVVVVKGRSAPLGYHGPVDDEGLIPGDDTAYAYGFSPFALEYAVPLGGRLGIFGAAAGGLIFFNKPFPVPEAKSNNFTIEYGGGVSLRVGRRTWLQAGYKYHHLSNAYRELVNPGLDGHVAYLGFWKGIGRRPGL